MQLVLKDLHAVVVERSGEIGNKIRKYVIKLLLIISKYIPLTLRNIIIILVVKV
jgi:hypothetical protein